MTIKPDGKQQLLDELKTLERLRQEHQRLVLENIKKMKNMGLPNSLTLKEKMNKQLEAMNKGTYDHAMLIKSHLEEPEEIATQTLCSLVAYVKELQKVIKTLIAKLVNHKHVDVGKKQTRKKNKNKNKNKEKKQKKYVTGSTLYDEVEVVEKIEGTIEVERRRELQNLRDVTSKFEQSGLNVEDVETKSKVVTSLIKTVEGFEAGNGDVDEIIQAQNLVKKLTLEEHNEAKKVQKKKMRMKFEKKANYVNNKEKKHVKN